MFDQFRQQQGMLPVHAMPDLVLRGGPEATIAVDDRVRFKLPADLHSRILQVNNRNPLIFISHVLPTHLSIYPINLWRPFEMFLSVNQGDRAVRSYLNKCMFYGQESNIEAQGRINIPKTIAEKMGIDKGSKVFVKGMIDRVDVVLEEKRNDYIKSFEEPNAEVDAAQSVYSRYLALVMEQYFGFNGKLTEPNFYQHPVAPNVENYKEKH